jgi:hypothetical protein
VRSPCCVCLWTPPSTSQWLNQFLQNSVFISRHLNPSQQHTYKSLPSVCVSVCVSLLTLLAKGSINCIHSFVTRQRLSNHVPVAMNTRNNRRIVGRVCLWVCMYIPLSLLGNNSVKTFSWQWRFVGDVVFCTVRVVSMESRWLVLPRNSYIRNVGSTPVLNCRIFMRSLLF